MYMKATKAARTYSFGVKGVGLSRSVLKRVGVVKKAHAMSVAALKTITRALKLLVAKTWRALKVLLGSDIPGLGGLKIGSEEGSQHPKRIHN